VDDPKAGWLANDYNAVRRQAWRPALLRRRLDRTLWGEPPPEERDSTLPSRSPSGLPAAVLRA